MTKRLQIRLLGGFDLTYDGERVISIEKSARLQSLLAFLLLNGTRPQPRQQIAFLFWPDTTESQARTNVRKLVFRLQNRLPDAAHYLTIENHTLRWNADSSYDLDVDLLEDALRAAEQDPADGTAVDEVMRLYKGALLPDAGEEWLNEPRQLLHRRVVNVLTNRADYCERQASFDEATAVVQRLLLLDPFDEAFYQRLIRLRARANDRSGAIRAFRAAETMLRDEIGVPPSPRTQLLYERIVSGQPFSGPVQHGRNDNAPIPLIGRQSEWHRLRTIYASLQSGDSRCVWISGEAGIGKTRLAEELLAWAYLDGCLVARTRSYAAHGDLAYAPVAQLLRRSELAQQLAKLDDVWLGELSRILPELLVQRPDLPPAEPLSQAGGAVRFYEALCNAILRGEQPIILLFDDLQWCDEETLTWLHYLLRYDHACRLLLVGAYRDEEMSSDHPLRAISNSLYREGQLTDIGLSPLGQAHAAQLAEAVFEDALKMAAQRQLVESAGGNPLFVVEMVRAQVSSAGEGVSGGKGGASVNLPPKIYALIQSRLAGVSPAAQGVLDMAALVGRSFEQQLLRAASPVAENSVAGALAELCEKRVLREHRAGIYDFTHDKLRDVVLGEMDDNQKRLLSSRIAATYESLYADRLDDIVGELAVVHESAGHERRAVSYYHQAAQAEMKRGAYKRAEAFLDQALALINGASNQKGWAEAELGLQLSLANVAQGIQLGRSPKARAAFARTLQLSRDTGNQTAQVQALWGLAHFHFVSGDLSGARAFCEQCISVARQADDQVSLVAAYLMFGLISLIRGDFLATRESTEWIHSQYDRELAQALTPLQGFDTGIVANIYLSCALWFLGFPEQSDAVMNQAQATAEELGIAMNLGMVADYQFLMSLMKRDLTEVSRRSDRLLELSERYDIVYAKTIGQMGHAYVAAAREPGDMRLIEAFSEQLVVYREQVVTLSQPLFLSLKARLLMLAKRYEEAQTVLMETIALMHASEDLYSAGEVYRRQGDLWMLTGEGKAAEAYLQAIAVTKKQEAKIFQLRATVSLCRLWQAEGKQVEAHRLLSEIYGWFAEGFDTHDLQEARALLDELEATR